MSGIPKGDRGIDGSIWISIPLLISYNQSASTQFIHSGADYWLRMDNCHVFVDESGDFGFSGKSSKYVILAAIFSEDVRRLERIPRRIRAENLKSRALRSDIELKFNSAFPQTRMRLLESVTELPCICIGSIVLDKTTVNDFFAEHRESLYLTMCKQLAVEIIRSQRIRKKINITFDRAPFHQRVTYCFKEYISNAIDEECRRLRLIPPGIKLQMNSPGTCQGLSRRFHCRSNSQEIFSRRSDKLQSHQRYDILRDALESYEKINAAPDRDFALKRHMAQVTVGKTVITDRDLPAIHNHGTSAKYNFRAESAS
jgi:hypothetical protein